MEERPPEAGEPPSADETEPRVYPEYQGGTWQFAGIVIRNALLGLVTLGFYRFWGKTRLRRYLWSHIGFLGDRFEYTGRAMELLRGFLVALAIFAPIIILYVVAEIMVESEAAKEAMQALNLLAFYLLIQFAVYRARRYRLSRTQWRGIRAGQSGSAVKYALRALAHLFVASITFGLAYPVMRTRLQSYRLNNTWFGDRSFKFDARARSLFPRWFVCWLLLLPTLGLSYFWYRAAEFRVFAAHTSYEDLRFDSNITGGSLLSIYLILFVAFLGAWLVIVAAVVALGALVIFVLIQGDAQGLGLATEEAGYVLQIISILLALIVLGILRQIIVVPRFVRLFCERLTVGGTADFAAIAQSQRPLPSRGEGLADILDMGGI